MNEERRRKLLLWTLAVAFAYGAWHWFGGGEEPAIRPGVRAAGGARPEPSLVTRLVELELGALEHKPGVYTPGRDPFRFGPPPAPPPSAAPPPAPQPDPDALRAAQARGPRLPALDVVYLGRFGPRERPIAVFSDGSEIYNAQVGDVLKQAFRVEQIGYESVDLSYVDHPEATFERLPVGG